MRKGRMKPRRSPATVLAVVALMAALGGSAIAANGLTGKEKKQVGKIAAKVFNSQIGNATVARAETANTARHAGSADAAGKAETADTATRANDAVQLGGRPSSDYQIRLQGSCAGEGIESIDSGGGVTCAEPVKGIIAKPFAEEVASETIGSSLRLKALCHSGGQVAIVFENTGSGAAILGWFYGDGTGATFASGAPLAAEAERAFTFTGARIAGTFTFSLESTVTTVDLSVFDATAYCRVLGTAVTASG